MCTAKMVATVMIKEILNTLLTRVVSDGNHLRVPCNRSKAQSHLADGSVHSAQRRRRLGRSLPRRDDLTEAGIEVAFYQFEILEQIALAVVSPLLACSPSR